KLEVGASESRVKQNLVADTQAPIGCFFFFQAEDGIRVFHVTGVQTCALPISITAASPPRELSPSVPPVSQRRASTRAPDRRRIEIGRASCRERVESSAEAVPRLRKQITLQDIESAATTHHGCVPVRDHTSRPH